MCRLCSAHTYIRHTMGKRLISKINADSCQCLALTSVECTGKTQRYGNCLRPKCTPLGPACTSKSIRGTFTIGLSGVSSCTRRSLGEISITRAFCPLTIFWAKFTLLMKTMIVPTLRLSMPGGPPLACIAFKISGAR